MPGMGEFFAATQAERVFHGAIGSAPGHAVSGTKTRLPAPQPRCSCRRLELLISGLIASLDPEPHG